jgi:hypothetical protein
MRYLSCPSSPLAPPPPHLIMLLANVCFDNCIKRPPMGWFIGARSRLVHYLMCHFHTFASRMKSTTRCLCQAPLTYCVDTLILHMLNTFVRAGVLGHMSSALLVYRAKWIAAICLSSTEYEFVIAVGTAKFSKYLHAILLEIAVHQLEATELYEDNVSAILMANDKRPTDRSRHINIQQFSLQ